MRPDQIIVLIAAVLSVGCCQYFNPSDANTTTNQPPVVNLELNESSGSAPFSPYYTYLCYDPESKIVSCEIKLDGKSYAKGKDQDALFPETFIEPDFYWEATKQTGQHTLEIIGIDEEGLVSSEKVTFMVLEGLMLTEPGWYRCNEIDNEPCKSFQDAYCDKFVPTDIDVRTAASEAIANHPGAFSVNQLLDIYDWVHANVAYQNVPVNLTYQPYPAKETLVTKSGDCKNQAVLIASMVEAIGGSARVLLIPGCVHAFAEVYLGNDEDVEAINEAIYEHYAITNEEYQSIKWHTSINSKNETENWFIFDTAGGRFPGQTIEGCFDAEQTFEIHNCFADRELVAPKVDNIEYGPYVTINESQIISADGHYYYYYIEQNNIPSFYSWCRYKISVQSSSGPIDWYVTDQKGYDDYSEDRTPEYYYGEAQVQGGAYQIDWDSSDRFYIIIVNNGQMPVTVKTQTVETCYK